MAKRGNRLREFEKNNRVLDISSKQEARREKRKEQRRKEREKENNEADSGSDDIVREFKKEKQETKINWKKIVPRVVILVFIVMMLGTLSNIHALKEKEKSLQEENMQLLKIKEELELEEKNVNSPDYIEAMARKDLKLAKSNELIFYFDESNESEKKEANEVTEEEAGNE